MDLGKALASFVTALRKANPGMTEEQIAAAAQAQLQAALNAPPAAVKKHTEPQPSGAIAPSDIPLAQ